jgi:hypothetical protein
VAHFKNPVDGCSQLWLDLAIDDGMADAVAYRVLVKLASLHGSLLTEIEWPNKQEIDALDSSNLLQVVEC